MTYNVSTSEVSTFLTCKQRWMYAHHPSYHLEPRTLGLALSRGLVGHAALEVYYKSIMESESHEVAVDKATAYLTRTALQEMKLGDTPKALMISSLGIVLKDYFEEHKWVLDTYNIIGVENKVVAPLPGVDDINIAGRIDLTLEVPSGPYKGEVIPWDHKFSYNFWPEMSVKMNPQISNYVWILRELGHHSRTGYINMLRYRENATESFKQEQVPSTSILREEFIQNHVVAAKQIVDLKHKKKVGLSDGVTRSASKFNCEYCPFVNLCYTQAQGLNTDNMIKASFRPNSYGYDNVLDVE